jgi:2,3-dihydroxybenzoate decarboxylase
MDKIALEEHFVIPDFLDYLANAMPRVTPDEYDRVVAMLSDFGEQRLFAMHGAGVKLAVLSMTGSGGPDRARHSTCHQESATG